MESSPGCAANFMSIEDAIKSLDTATMPQNVGKLGRQDYAYIEQALTVIRQFVESANAKSEVPPAPAG